LFAFITRVILLILSGVYEVHCAVADR